MSIALQSFNFYARQNTRELFVKYIQIYPKTHKNAQKKATLTVPIGTEGGRQKSPFATRSCNYLLQVGANGDKTKKAPRKRCLLCLIMPSYVGRSDQTDFRQKSPIATRRCSYLLQEGASEDRKRHRTNAMPFRLCQNTLV